MRAARRIIVLAGILAMAVFAPITWSQAGAQTEGDGETPPITFTFVKFMCADFGVIPGNVDDPTDSARGRRAPRSATPSAWSRSTRTRASAGASASTAGRSCWVPPTTSSRIPAREHGRSVAAAPDRNSSPDVGPARAPRARAAVRERGAAGWLRLRQSYGAGPTTGTATTSSILVSGDPLVCVAYNVGAPVTITRSSRDRSPTVPSS